MASDVVMPKMGFDMEEGTILRWMKSEGDEVAKGETLAEIETGKVNIEIEAFDQGVLRKILVDEGETVPVGTPIAIIAGADEEIEIPERPSGEAKAGAQSGAGAGAGAGDKGGDGESDDDSSAGDAGDAGGAGDDAQAARDAAADDRRERRDRKNGAAEKVADRSGRPGRPGRAKRVANGRESQDADLEGEDWDADGRLRASPLARRMAEEHDLDLRDIAPGSGPHGRVVRDDVEAAIEEGVPTRRRERVGYADYAAPADAIGGEMPGHREELSRMRQTIARRLSSSWVEAPHIFLTMAVETDAMLEARKRINEGLEAAGEGKVSLNDLIVKGVARALRRHPLMNVSYDDGERIVHDRVNVGVAVALDDGLITLTMADADRRPLSQIAAEIRDKAERARSGKLNPDDFAVPSTFTVSNLGMYGIEEFTAILNPPEAGILAVGASVPSAVVRDGEVVIRSMMRITLSADHRIVDGASAAEFLVTLRDLLENPMVILT